MSFSLIMDTKRFTTMFNNRSYTVQNDHPRYEDLLQAVKDGDDVAFLKAFTADRAVKEAFKTTGVEVKDGAVYFNGEAVHSALSRRIVEFAEKELPVAHMMTFLKNLMDNPSRRAVQELYTFLEHRNLPITEDGCFLAYKSVRENYLDKYSGTFDNSVGQTMEMPRNAVDDQADRTCSHGFHVGSLEYAGPGGFFNGHNDKVVIVKVNPKDAVSVPADHNAMKLRVCKYEVVGEYEHPLDDSLEVKEKPEPAPTSVGQHISRLKQQCRGKNADEVADDIRLQYRQLGGLAPGRSISDSMEFSHWSKPNWREPLKRTPINTKRRLYEYSNGDSIMLCYNTDGTVRWKSTHTALNYWFERYSEAY